MADDNLHDMAASETLSQQLLNSKVYSPYPFGFISNGAARTQNNQTDGDHLSSTSDMISSKEPERREQSKQAIESGDGVII